MRILKRTSIILFAVGFVLAGVGALLGGIDAAEILFWM
jgi:hypothetical protein